jgi:hypothetical protein
MCFLPAEIEIHADTRLDRGSVLSRPQIRVFACCRASYAIGPGVSLPQRGSWRLPLELNPHSSFIPPEETACGPAPRR